MTVRVKFEIFTHNAEHIRDRNILLLSYIIHIKLENLQ